MQLNKEIKPSCEPVTKIVRPVRYIYIFFSFNWADWVLTSLLLWKILVYYLYAIDICKVQKQNKEEGGIEFLSKKNGKLIEKRKRTTSHLTERPREGNTCLVGYIRGSFVRFVAFFETWAPSLINSHEVYPSARLSGLRLLRTGYVLKITDNFKARFTTELWKN